MTTPMTLEELTRLATQRMKDVNLETAKLIAQKWKIPPEEVSDVIAGATFGLGVAMMFESGMDEDQIVASVRRLVTSLSASPEGRGAS